MARYIDADNLLEKLHRMIDYCEKDRKVNAVTALFQVGDAIMDCPTADVQEVRHGKWIGYPSITKSIIYKCSCCGKSNGRAKPLYCKNCGAKMDGKETT